MRVHYTSKEKQFAKRIFKIANPSADYLYHGIRVADPLLKEKVLSILEHGILCFDELKKIKSDEFIKMVQKQRDGAFFNGDDFVSLFAWSKNKRLNIRSAWLFQTMRNKINFVIDKSDFSKQLQDASGEVQILGFVPQKNIIGIAVSRYCENIEKTLKHVFADTGVDLPLYDIDTTTIIGRTSNITNIQLINPKMISTKEGMLR